MKKNRKILLLMLLFIMVYLALLFVLFISEKGGAESQIDSFGDAFWFSIVTLSTVGYGDMTPKTPAGYAIGCIFLVLSMGMLVAMIGYAVSFLTNEGLPMLKLRLRRSDNWYYFADFTGESDTLARDILREDPDAVIIYGIRRDDEIERPDYSCFFLNDSPARIVARKKNAGKPCSLFFLKENDIGTNLKAIGIHKLPAEVYASTTSGIEKMSGNIHFFHTYDCCARSYWRNHPLGSVENEVVIIGFGNYGTAILERAILTNIVDPFFDVNYHVFGDSERFRQIHANLSLAFGINEKREGCDNIFFHDEEWTSARDIIAGADRIIICEDKVETGWDDLWMLQRYYKVSGKIHLRSNRVAPGVSYFGTNDEIYTVNQIVRARLNDAAMAMNDLYRRGDEYGLDWEELSDRLKQSKIAAADHLLIKVRILLGENFASDINRKTFKAAYDAFSTARRDEDLLDDLRRIEHARWIRFYTYYNWSCGPENSEELREDPKICEYDLLTDGQKAYFDNAWELLGEIGKMTKKRKTN